MRKSRRDFLEGMALMGVAAVVPNVLGGPYEMRVENGFDISKKKVFVCDLDGTLFIGARPIKPAVDFVIDSTKRGRFGFFYLTNNTSKTPAEFMKKIASPVVLSLVIVPETVRLPLTVKFLAIDTFDPLNSKALGLTFKHAV